MVRENMLNKIRTALNAAPGRPLPPIPLPRLPLLDTDLEARILQFGKSVENLAGKFMHAVSKADACSYASAVLQGKTAVASNSPFLKECGLISLPGVKSDLFDEAELRRWSAGVDIGITSADFALADTGTLVMLSSAEEARMISLLPPVHLAVIPCKRILSGLEELFSLLPQPATQTSSMVFITGPSRSADIEQILIRGVHGPGEIHIVAV
jgi:L-lactate dehydrogenase complex protein LldG